jgi:hypothetical protein
MKFKAIIRVVKSLSNDSDFGPTDVLREPLIEANDKSEVKDKGNYRGLGTR